ncbi:DUF7129 domain-containing putative zinc-binding protein [Halalkalicoccus ordinarius]
MTGRDPYDPSESSYERTVCQSRTVSSDHRGRCPDRGETVRNLAVGRE